MHNKRNLSEVGGVYTQWEGPTWEMPMHRGINMHWEESIQIGMSLSGRGGGVGGLNTVGGVCLRDGYAQRNLSAVGGI